MFYRIIERKRNEWLSSKDCAVKDLVCYIERQGKMRDAQIDCIKTYLYLKIECHNRPLWELVTSGKFNTMDVDTLEVNRATRDNLENNPAALALWEYAALPDANGNPNSPKIMDAIKRNPTSIDYVEVIKALFGNVSYTDYLFSIPMGAGKTYLMAALIYLNLYFAVSEPDNPLFAHNFMLFVPSGLKSSIVPSLKDIQTFDPLWILPDPIATHLKYLIRYEWLQESASASKSNIVRNPNARKISMHTALPDLMGLVAVTNAEKVILDRIERDFNIDMTVFKDLSVEERREYEAAKAANELREQIGQIPGLCILIDEVHHASDDQKLRKVVDQWMQQSNLNSVLGFSGTPNMDPPARISITEDLTVKCTQYANVVTYYPLIDGIGNFLKIPTVRHADFESSEIIGHGIREFFERYRDTVYADGACAKLAIYAPSIDVLEEELYPEACTLCEDLGISASEAILKYHKGNKRFKADEDAAFEFSTLDSPLSKKRIILLVGIGREGWNCKSLTGVILSQRNACPQNMVLQISCRCLREVASARQETALIWLNRFNADKLNQQLLQQQYISLKEFSSKRPDNMVTVQRFSRMSTLDLPPLKYYQLRIHYNTVETEYIADIDDYLHAYDIPYKDPDVIHTQSFTLDSGGRASESGRRYGTEETVTFRTWIDRMVKEGFGLLAVNRLMEHESSLKELFGRITLSDDSGLLLNPDIDQCKVRADIRNCFSTIRRFNTSEEVVPAEASLLKVDSLTSPKDFPAKAILVPDSEEVEEIMTYDTAPASTPISEEERSFLMAMKARGIAIDIPETPTPKVYDRTFHYLPYHLDSPLEEDYFSAVLNHLHDVPDVEFYFNGDETLTEFRIRCYQKRGTIWKMTGYYYPDFIMLTRNPDNTIAKVIIIETKGKGFSGNFEPRRRFMEETFVRLNADNPGYPKFHFLYIEDTMEASVRLSKTIQAIRNFLLN